VPDRLFITPHGFMFFVEFKALGKAPTAPQQREHERLRKQGVIVLVVDDVEFGKTMVDRMLARV